MNCLSGMLRDSSACLNLVPVTGAGLEHECMYCVSYVIPRMVGVLFSRSDCPFKVTERHGLNSCLSQVKRVIEEFYGYAVILLCVSHCSSCVLHHCILSLKKSSRFVRHEQFHWKSCCESLSGGPLNGLQSYPKWWFP